MWVGELGELWGVSVWGGTGCCRVGGLLECECVGVLQGGAAGGAAGRCCREVLRGSYCAERGGGLGGYWSASVRGCCREVLQGGSCAERGGGFQPLCLIPTHPPASHFTLYLGRPIVGAVWARVSSASHSPSVMALSLMQLGSPVSGNTSYRTMKWCPSPS